MTSIIRFRPLSGGVAETSEEAGPHCYLLEVDQFTLLLDCGWDPSSVNPEKSEGSEKTRELLKRHAEKVDAVLVSHPDLLHLGGLPHATGRLGLSCPIYATVPVYKMGQMFLYDAYQAGHSVCSDFNSRHFTLDEVDRTFEMFHQLKFNQTVNLKGTNITITPLPAGHMIGGCVWKIQKDQEEDIVYAVDYNHKRERHLNGAEFADKIVRPSLFITDCFNVSLKQMRRRNRDEKLMTTILQTARGGGSVLVAVDTAGRVLELAHMLDQLWQNKDSGLVAYSLALLNNVSYNVVEFAKSQIEWMSEKLMRTFNKSNPFQFRHVKLCHSMAEVSKVPSPKVVLASLPDLEMGFSRELFATWAPNSKNSIILTSRAPKGTLAYDLITNGGNDRAISLEMTKRVKLAGQELEDHKKGLLQQQLQQQLQQLDSDGKKAMMAVDMEDSSSSSDEEMGMDEPPLKKVGGGGGVGVGVGGGGGGSHGSLMGGGSGNVSVKHDIIMKKSSSSSSATSLPLASSGSSVVVNNGASLPDSVAHLPRQSFFKSTKAKFLMFPFHEEKIKWDDYGELVRPSDWVDASQDPKDPSDNKDDPEKPGLDPRNQQGASLSQQSQEVPTKCVTSTIKLKVRAQVMYIDFEGRSDGESIQKCLMQIKPRRVIVVRGSNDDGRMLTDFCDRQFEGQDYRAFAPKNGELIDATTESYIYQVRLPDSLLSLLDFKAAGRDGSMLAWVDGVIQTKGDNSMEDEMEENDAKIEGYTSNGWSKPTIPTLHPVPADEAPGHEASFVNELKLSDFKIVLQKHNIPSEFQGGVLFCGRTNSVALRRHDSGRVAIEGCLCDDFYLVRSLLYDRYAIV